MGVRLRQSAGATIKGVAKLNGQAIEYGRVIAGNNDGALVFGAVGPDGSFVIKGTPAGQITVTLDDRLGGLGSAPEPVKLSVVAGEEYEVDLSWGQPMGTISVRLLGV